MNLQGKIVLVTGGSRGIGASIAKECADAGATIIVNYASSAERAAQVVTELREKSPKSSSVKADISNFTDVQNMAALIAKDFGKVDVLVNNAGIIRDRTLKNMTQEEWHKVIDTNLTGVYNVTKNILPLIPEGGRVINISSIVGQLGNFGQTNYAAAKAGLIGFTKSLAKEVGKKQITVNAIAPGFVKTEITQDLPFIRKKIIHYMTPLKDLAEPEDIAYAVVFLASDRSRYITGSVINVDGGLAF